MGGPFPLQRGPLRPQDWPLRAVTGRGRQGAVAASLIEALSFFPCPGFWSSYNCKYSFLAPLGKWLDSRGHASLGCVARGAG